MMIWLDWMIIVIFVLFFPAVGFSLNRRERIKATCPNCNIPTLDARTIYVSAKFSQVRETCDNCGLSRDTFA